MNLNKLPKLRFRKGLSEVYYLDLSLLSSYEISIDFSAKNK